MASGPRDSGRIRIRAAHLAGVPFEDLFAKLPFHYKWWPVIGGLVVGLGGLLFPRALGVGYDTIGDLLNGRLVGSFQALIVTYPDELLEEAVDKLARYDIGRLPVVDRSHPTRLVGYLGRKGIATAWREIAQEEQVRAVGWLSGRARLLRMKVRRATSQGDDQQHLAS